MIFITPSHKPDILEKNLLKSKIKHKLIIKKGYTNVCKAYNDVKVKGIRVYLHHDVFLPDDFEANLLKAIKEIESIDHNWGVLGVAGAVPTLDGKKTYGNLLDRGNQWGDPKELPHEVQTLDELILIIKDPDLKFDENIPSNHFYGADICIQANLKGKKNYAINAYLHHNSGLQVGERPAEFYQARDYMITKYKMQFPIATTCTKIC